MLIKMLLVFAIELKDKGIYFSSNITACSTLLN